MLNLQKIKIEYCMDQLSKAYERNYSKIEQELETSSSGPPTWRSKTSPTPMPFTTTWSTP